MSPIEQFFDVLRGINGLIAAVVLDLEERSLVGHWGHIPDPVKMMMAVGALAKGKNEFCAAIDDPHNLALPMKEGLFFHKEHLYLIKSVQNQGKRWLCYLTFDRKRTNMASIRIVVDRFEVVL